MKKSLFKSSFYFRQWCYFLVLPICLILSNSLSATESETDGNMEGNVEVIKDGEEIILDDDYYIGVFVGSSDAQNEHTDVEGFANWGNPGASVSYSDAGSVGGVLIGKRLSIKGMPVRIEVDGTFGDMSASTNKLDPEGLDETAKSNIRWLVTARVGLEKKFGIANLFVDGGLAVARVFNSVIDIDFGPNRPPQKDPDDSFSDDSIRLGWALGFGAEIPLNKGDRKTLRSDGDGAWVLRMEGSYINLGKESYKVNHSGNNSCGVGGPRRPCLYNIKNEVGIIQLAIIRRFSL